MFRLPPYVEFLSVTPSHRPIPPPDFLLPSTITDRENLARKNGYSIPYASYGPTIFDSFFTSPSPTKLEREGEIFIEENDFHGGINLGRKGQRDLTGVIGTGSERFVGEATAMQPNPIPLALDPLSLSSARCLLPPAPSCRSPRVSPVTVPVRAPQTLVDISTAPSHAATPRRTPASRVWTQLYYALLAHAALRCQPTAPAALSCGSDVHSARCTLCTNRCALLPPDDVSSRSTPAIQCRMRSSPNYHRG